MARLQDFETVLESFPAHVKKAVYALTLGRTGFSALMPGTATCLFLLLFYFAVILLPVSNYLVLSLVLGVVIAGSYVLAWVYGDKALGFLKHNFTLEREMPFGMVVIDKVFGQSIATLPVLLVANKIHQLLVVMYALLFFRVVEVIVTRTALFSFFGFRKRASLKAKVSIHHLMADDAVAGVITAGIFVIVYYLYHLQQTV